jgi:hypothetical protein
VLRDDLSEARGCGLARLHAVSSRNARLQAFKAAIGRPVELRPFARFEPAKGVKPELHRADAQDHELLSNRRIRSSASSRRTTRRPCEAAPPKDSGIRTDDLAAIAIQTSRALRATLV